MSIPAIKNPQYEVIDLGAFDEAYKGQEMRVMVNPSRAFRLGFIEAALNPTTEDFISYIATIAGLNGDDETAQVFDDMPADVFQWLFCYTVVERDGKPEAIRPHVLTLWDDRIVARVKAHAAQPKVSEKPLNGSQAAN